MPSTKRSPDPPARGSARALAIRVLVRVEVEDAYADLALSAELSRSSLNERDRAFASDLVYGTLRWQGQLDYHLQERAPRGLDKLPMQARIALRMGAYQILHSRSVPARAAVDETVRTIRDQRLEGLTGFANALLRRLVRDREDLTYPDPTADPVAHAAALHAHPPWLVTRLFDRLGREEALALLEADNHLPPLTLRAHTPRTTRDALIARLAQQGYAARPGKYAPAAVILEKRAPVEKLPGFSEGTFVVQDEASQLVGSLVGAQSGERVLDACAAPGGKTAHLAESVGSTGQVVALDSHAGRLGLVEKLCERLGLKNVIPIQGDASTPPAGVAEKQFDRVLVDAPCTGLGVLRRNPDARWRVKASAPERLARIQRSILQGTLPLVRRGGTLVYSVCTYTPEETSGVIAEILAKSKGFVIEDAGSRLGVGCREVLYDESFGEVLRTWPHKHGTDAFFAVRLRRDA